MLLACFLFSDLAYTDDTMVAAPSSRNICTEDECDGLSLVDPDVFTLSKFSAEGTEAEVSVNVMSTAYTVSFM